MLQLICSDIGTGGQFYTLDRNSILSTRKWRAAWSCGQASDLSMQPGRRLREAREALRLRFRDVEQASQKIAALRRNPDFAIGLSRLADIENKGTLPTVYRLYSLCAIYRLEFTSVLRWYGVALDDLPMDAAHLILDETHLVGFEPNGRMSGFIPSDCDTDFDPAVTSFISRHIHQWGRLPLALFGATDFRKGRYGYIGANDWFMYPILIPGSFVQIDETKRRIAKDGWTHECERPLYFIEHRNGYTCAWCTEHSGLLILQPHSASKEAPRIYKLPGEAEVVGQVIAVAMRLDLAKRRHTHF
jgi:transcriptional regulator with XRE-family HTH domain